MKLIDRNLIILSAGVAVTLFSTGVACAIGPADQLVTDPVAIPNPALYGVVTVDNPGPSGTGTVVGVEQDPLGGGNYKDIVDVITADHVVAGANNGTILFGATGTAATFNWAYWQNYWTSGGQREDIALIQATAINVPNATWTNIVNSVASVANPALGLEPGGNPFLFSTSQSFTEVGYGLLGTYNPAIAALAGNPAGYQIGALNTFGTRRFQNNMQTGAITAPAAHGIYFEPLVPFNILSPSNAGGGAGMPGDSGGPLFTGPYGGSPVPSGINRGDGNIPINYTNNLSAVYVGLGTSQTGTDGNRYRLVGTNQNAVPIDAGVYDWLSTW